MKCLLTFRYIEENKDMIGDDVFPVITSLRLEMMDPSFIKIHLIDNATIGQNPALHKYIQVKS